MNRPSMRISFGEQSIGCCESNVPIQAISERLLVSLNIADKIQRYMEDSKTIRARVPVARERQLERFKGTKLTCNAEMGPMDSQLLSCQKANVIIIES